MGSFKGLKEYDGYKIFKTDKGKLVRDDYYIEKVEEADQCKVIPAEQVFMTGFAIFLCKPAAATVKI